MNYVLTERWEKNERTSNDVDTMLLICDNRRLEFVVSTRTGTQLPEIALQSKQGVVYRDG